MRRELGEGGGELNEMVIQVSRRKEKEGVLRVDSLLEHLRVLKAATSFQLELHGVSVVWCGGVWCGVVWCGVVWCGGVSVMWCGVVWYGVVWCGVVWYGVVWCGVVWCGVVECP